MPCTGSASVVMIFNNPFFWGKSSLYSRVVGEGDGAGMVGWYGWLPFRQRCFVCSRLVSGSAANLVNKICTKFENV